MTKNKRIHVPGLVNINAQFHPGQNADPVAVQLNSADTIEMVVTGGESKPERHAVALLAGMMANPSLTNYERESRDELAEAAVDMAYRIQAALAKRAEVESKPPNGKLET